MKKAIRKGNYRWKELEEVEDPPGELSLELALAGLHNSTLDHPSVTLHLTFPLVTALHFKQRLLFFHALRVKVKGNPVFFQDFSSLRIGRLRMGSLHRSFYAVLIIPTLNVSKKPSPIFQNGKNKEVNL